MVLKNAKDNRDILPVVDAMAPTLGVNGEIGELSTWGYILVRKWIVGE